MIGAIIGDIAGSKLVTHPGRIRDEKYIKEFKGVFTDDTVETIAVAQALLKCEGEYKNLSEYTKICLKRFCSKYDHIGYGAMMSRWIRDPDLKPYNSFGNGCAMRVSPCAFAAQSLREVLDLAYRVSVVTHNHPEGIKGAQAIAAAAYLARNGTPLDAIKEYINDNFYIINFTLDEIRPHYLFNSTCQGSVPQALEAFFESHDFESAILNALSLGADADTLAAMCGTVASAYYGVPRYLKERALSFLDDCLIKVIKDFERDIAACKVTD